jgi:hypothetical protein
MKYTKENPHSNADFTIFTQAIGEISKFQKRKGNPDFSL